MGSNASAELRRLALSNWANFLFIMSISLAHECVHMFVGMLNGGRARPRTPLTVQWDIDDTEEYPNVHTTQAEDNWILRPDWNQIPAGLEHKISGESGYAWEARVFGGKVACYSSNSLLLPGRTREESSGTPYFVWKTNDGRFKARRIYLPYVKAFINYGTALSCTFVSFQIALLTSRAGFSRHVTNPNQAMLPLKHQHLTQEIVPRSRVMHKDMTELRKAL